MPVSEKFTSIHSLEWEINFTQCNPGGYLKYSELCNILQLAAADHAELGGISFTDMQAAHQAWVLSRMRVEVKRLPKWREKIRLSTWIISLENSRSVRAIEIYSGQEKIVGCETFWSVFNTSTRRPEYLALPHEHFELYAGKHSTEARVKKIDITGTGQPIEIRSVKVSDLDIVNHVNNVRYLEWCLDLVQPEIVLENKITAMDMNFARELLLGDEIEISRIVAGDLVTFAITRNSLHCFALQLQTKP
jgi:medium-chain acyl-[acyl-carrier-protein] hydrolase